MPEGVLLMPSFQTSFSCFPEQFGDIVGVGVCDGGLPKKAWVDPKGADGLAEHYIMRFSIALILLFGFSQIIKGHKSWLVLSERAEDLEKGKSQVLRYKLS